MDKPLTLDELKFFWHDNYQKINLRYITEEKTFIRYSEEKGLWERIYDNKARVELWGIVGKLRKQYLENRNEENDYSRHLNLLLRDSWIKSGIKIIKEMGHIRKKDLDKNPDELVVKNGVLNLRTGELKPFNRENFNTKGSPFNYKTKKELEKLPQEKRDKFKKILQVLDEDTLKYTQTVLGQSLTGMQPHGAKIFWLYGKGANGKSTIINLISSVGGKWAKIQFAEILSVRPYQVPYSPLSNCRIALVEAAPVEHISRDKVKKLAESKTVTIRKKQKKTYEEDVIWSFFITANALPNIKNTESDKDLFKSFIIIPFPETFCPKNPNYDSSLFDADRDNDICELFLNWIVEGSMRWFNDPNSENDFSPEMIKIMNRWGNRGKEEEWDDSSPVKSFLNKAIKKDDNSAIGLDELFEYFLKFSEDNNKKSKLSKLKFKREVEQILGVDFALKKRIGKYRYSTFLKEYDRDSRKTKLFNFSFKDNFTP